MQTLLKDYASWYNCFRTDPRQSVQTVPEILFEPKIYKETKKHSSKHLYKN